MKRLLPLCLCLALFCGCSLPISNDYLSVREHYDPYTYKEETVEETPQLQIVDQYYDMRNAFTKYIKEGLETVEVACRSYKGDLEKDIVKLYEFFTKSHAIISYLTEKIEFTILPVGAENGANAAASDDRIVKMEVSYRRPADEYIETYRENTVGINKLKEALRSFSPSLTIQVSGFTDEDVAETLNIYCTENPELFPEFPRLDIQLFPDEGNIRVIEAHFKYSSDNSTGQTLVEKRDALGTELEMFISSVHARARRLTCPSISNILSEGCEELKGSFNYEEVPNASVYSLLHSGLGNSRCFAALTYHICREWTILSTVVHGTKDGEDYYWCIVRTGEGYRHVDMRTAVAEKTSLSFLSDEEMEGYEWDRAKYPPCVGTQEPPAEA